MKQSGYVTTYWRKSGAIGLATVKVVSENIDDAVNYAAENNLEAMFTYSARSIERVITLGVSK